MEKFKDRTDFKTLEQVQSLPEYAGILAKNTMFIDIDDPEQFNSFLNFFCVQGKNVSVFMFMCPFAVFM